MTQESGIYTKMGQRWCTENATKSQLQKNTAAVLHMQDKDLTRKFSNAKSVPDAL